MQLVSVKLLPIGLGEMYVRPCRILLDLGVVDLFFSFCLGTAYQWKLKKVRTLAARTRDVSPVLPTDNIYLYFLIVATSVDTVSVQSTNYSSD